MRRDFFTQKYAHINESSYTYGAIAKTIYRIYHVSGTKNENPSVSYDVYTIKWYGLAYMMGKKTHIVLKCRTFVYISLFQLMEEQ